MIESTRLNMFLFIIRVLIIVKRRHVSFGSEKLAPFNVMFLALRLKGVPLFGANKFFQGQVSICFAKPFSNPKR